MLQLRTTIYLLLFSFILKSQPAIFNQTIGLSAVSISTISCKTFSFESSIYNAKFDSISNRLYVSTRKKDASGNFYSKNGVIASVNIANDSVNWHKTSTELNIGLNNELLIASSDNKTALLKANFGYEEKIFEGKMLYSFKNTILFYNKNKKLVAYDLITKTEKWTADVPAEYNWNDVKHLNDSTIIIAAGGLYALHYNKGLLWKISEKTTTAPENKFTISQMLNNYINNNVNSVYTSTVQNQISALASNILIEKNRIYFAGTENVICANATDGKLIWEHSLKSYQPSQMILRLEESVIVLISTGKAAFNDQAVVYGKSFILKLISENGSEIFYNDSKIGSFIDFLQFKNNLLFADRVDLTRTNISNTLLQNLLEINEHNYGRFVEFIDGNKYYIEKEGYFLPLNFINDNVIYFKTENDKVYGVTNNFIEYEYHFTELYKFNCENNQYTLVTQQNKSLILNKNFELIARIDAECKGMFIGNKLALLNNRLLQLINLNF
ncbi:MAG: PQQ-like beta-propeller repeat protein [Bacteroidetes bacterium]|nr:PQQ-like beta-propeller repeat protein [Bacteroidota bacterium]